METVSTSIYKDEIESIRDESDFESIGDENYLNHPDDEARLLWAFHRPSGSHPIQVSDPNVDVAIMAFNHSRLGAYERFTRLNPSVIEDAVLRNKIRNRSRMLFRALVDDDFSELLMVLDFAPVFIDMACDQMINGRIWNENYASALNASLFLGKLSDPLDDRLLEGVYRRLKPLKNYVFDDAKILLGELVSQVQKLHPQIKAHYVGEFEQWIGTERLHPLQAIMLNKQLALLKESHE